MIKVLEHENKTLFSYDLMFIQHAAHIKRFLELWTMLPGFQQLSLDKMREEAALYGAKLNIEEALYFCKIPDDASISPDLPKDLPAAVRDYQQFIHDKLLHREILQKQGCAPDNIRFNKWRERQLNRCWGELGQRNKAIIHTPLMFELSLGCSIGCPFCGLAAAKLSDVYKGSPENLTLWRDVLQIALESIGPAAATGTCYYATEPLDNPEYEKFAKIYYDVLGSLPQLTTACAMKDPKRTRKALIEMQALDTKIHRFSVLSLAQCKGIMHAFTPEELLLVELLPQFKEAPHNKFAQTGRQLSADKEDQHDTIACTSGFVVNMAKRTIMLKTPCGANPDSPTGELLIASEHFTDAADFKRTLNRMIDTCMPTNASNGAPLKFYPYFTYIAHEQGFSLKATTGYTLHVPGYESDNKNALGLLGQKISEQALTPDEMARCLMEEANIAPEQTYFAINKLYKGGLLIEQQEDKHL